MTSRKGQQILKKFSKGFMDNFDKVMSEIEEHATGEKEANAIQKALTIYIICEILEGWSKEDQDSVLGALNENFGTDK